MSRSIQTLEKQIEEDIRNLGYLRNLIAYQKEKIAFANKPRQEEEKFKLQREMVGFQKQEQDAIKALREDRITLAKYQHTLDLAEKEVQQDKPTEAPASDVELDPREQEFLNSMK